MRIGAVVTLSVSVSLPYLVLFAAHASGQEAAPWSQSVALGHPAHPFVFRLDATDGAVHLHTTGLDATLPLASFASAELQAITLQGGEAVAVLTVTGDDGRAAAVLAAPHGRPAVVWSERTDLRGDPGERHAGVVDVADRTGDGVPDVVVGEVVEGVHVCGADQTILDPHAYRPDRERLEPVELSQLPSTGPPGTAGSSGVGATTPVTATVETPGPTGAPAGGPLRWQSASSTSGASEEDTHRAPRALERPDADFWAEGQGGPGRGAFVTATRELALPIRAFAITPLPALPAGAAAVAAQLSAPTRLWIVGEDRLRLLVTLPAAPPGTRLWVVPPEPEAWRCISVVLDAPPTDARNHAVHTALAAVEAYTDLDFAGGEERLVREIASDGPAADAASDALARSGDDGIALLVAAVLRMTPAGKRRTVRVLSTSTSAAAQSALATLAVDGDDEVRAAADAVLARSPAGLAALAAVAMSEGAAGDDAARAVGGARVASVDALREMLAALGGHDGADRPALRDAVGGIVARLSAASPVPAGVNGADVADALRAWAATASPDAIAALALALASAGGARDGGVGTLATEVAAVAMTHADGFTARWRLTRALGRLPDDAAGDTWLAGVARHAEEWMLRDAAVAAMATRGSPSATDVARAAATDPYPRVRVTALVVLSRSDEERDVVSLATLARRDSWPLVRAAAVQALAPKPRARPILRAALGDVNEGVRAAAVAALTSVRDRESYPQIEARLRDDQEWPSVETASVAYVDAMCIHEAGDALVAVVHRAIKPTPYEPDVEVAVQALTAAARLGGPAAHDALDLAARGGSPDALRAAAAALRAHPLPPCGP